MNLFKRIFGEQPKAPPPSVVSPARPPQPPLKPLIASLTDDAEQARTALDALAAHRQAAVPDLLALLSHPSAQTRKLAAAGLLKLGGPDAEALAPALTTWATDAAPKPIVVDPQGGADYRTLAEAVAAAPDGALLRLAPGVHTLAEPLVIQKSLTLLGDHMDSCAVVCAGHWYVVQFAGPGPFGAVGISFEHRGHCWGAGVEAISGQITFSRCRFKGGIASAISPEGWSPLLPDLKERGLERELMNPFHMLAGEAMRIGSGLWLYDNVRADLAGCEATGNEGDGIVLEENATLHARDNNCHHNGRSGFFLTGASTSTVSGNSCHDNTDSGIVYCQQAAGKAIQNQCNSNGLAGIGALGASAPVLERNICTANQRLGIGFMGETAGSALENVCTRNITGIAVGEQARPTLERNRCDRNMSNGITFYGQARGCASYNQSAGNAANGIEVNGEAVSSLTGNTCQDNAKCGILFLDGGSGAAEGNRCTGNTFGIAIQAPAQPCMMNNISTGNRQHDLLRLGN